MTAAAGRVAASLGAVVVVVLLAGGADADCFDYCYRNCIANDRSMVDYCNYACDKTCQPGMPLLPRPCSDMDCQLSCAWASCRRLRPDGKAMEACFGQCYDGCKATTATLLPRPLRAGASAGVHTAMEPVSDAVRPLHSDMAYAPDPIHMSEIEVVAPNPDHA